MIVQLPLAEGEVAVLFRLPSSIWADSVCLVGDFNGWSTSATPMRRGEQFWEAALKLPAGATYYYAYLVDGVDWCSDLPSDRRTAGLSPQPIRLLPIEIAGVRRGAG
ncbi:MAG TPA: isoamylase early set domain-containing protein [Chloroflexaceae bacterium]|nr:isoamylase early set domain-containing protein [Chloroflexaceae bacterium]